MEIKGVMPISSIYKLVNNSLAVSKKAQKTATAKIKQNVKLDKLDDEDSALTNLNGKLLDLKSSAQKIVRSGSNVFDKLKVVSSNAQVVSATATPLAARKTYELTITSLAQSQINWSFTVAAITGNSNATEDTVLTGVSGTLSINNQDITIGVSGVTDTLERIRDKINETDNIDVSASIGGGRLVITSTSGLTNEIDVTDGTTGGSAGGSGGLGLSRSADSGSSDATAAIAQASQNAVFSVTERQINSSFTVKILSGDSDTTANTRLSTLGGILTLNDVEFTMGVVGETDTLNNIVETINDAEVGVRAEVKEDRLFLVADSSAQNYFTIDDRTTGGLSAIGGLGLARSAGADSVDASAGLVQAAGATVNLTSISNDVEDAISHVILNLKSLSSVDEEGVAFATLEVLSPTLKADSDTKTISSTIDRFFQDHNSVVKEINKLITVDQATGSEGQFYGSTILKSFGNRLLRTIATPVSIGGVTYSLADIGSRVNSDGTLNVNKNKMEQAISSDFAKIEALFTDSTVGIATRMNNLLGSLFPANRVPSSGVQTKGAFDTFTERYGSDGLAPEEDHYIDFVV